MLASIYKKIIIDFSKITLTILLLIILFSFYQSKNFNLDASSDALLLEGDPELKYLWNKRFPCFNLHTSL